MKTPKQYPEGWFARPIWFPFRSRLCDPDDPLCVMRAKDRRTASQLSALSREKQRELGIGWGVGTIYGIGIKSTGRDVGWMHGKQRTRASV